MILIAGGGIAGLAAAIALSPFSDVIVVERRSAGEANAGAGIQLSPNAVKALAALGMRDKVEAVATAPEALTIARPGAAPAVRLPYCGMEQRYGAPALTAARADLHAALIQEAQARPSISVVHDRSIDGVRRVAGGWLLPGSGDTARLLVAADGVGSAVRLAHLGDAPRETPWIAWRGRGGAPQGETALTLAGGRHLVRYALPRGGDNAVLVAREAARHPSTMGRAFAGALDDVADWTPWPIRVRRAHAFHGDGLAVVGDASHAVTPFLAQGAAMALEDAAVLKAAVRREGLAEKALATYAAARRPRTLRVAAQSRRQAAIYHLRAPFSLARDWAMARLGPEGVLAQVDWLYRWEPPG